MKATRDTPAVSPLNNFIEGLLEWVGEPTSVRTGASARGGVYAEADREEARRDHPMVGLQGQPGPHQGQSAPEDAEISLVLTVQVEARRREPAEAAATTTTTAAAVAVVGAVAVPPAPGVLAATAPSPPSPPEVVRLLPPSPAKTTLSWASPPFSPYCRRLVGAPCCRPRRRRRR
jgi:hypothetical protein